MKLATLAVLSESEIKQIHQTSLDLLATCGVNVRHKRMLAFLAERGLEVDWDRQVVRFSRLCVEEALATVPAQFEVFDRDGKFAFVLGDGLSKIAAGHNAVFWVDSETGLTRTSTVADVEFCARLCQALPNLDMIGVPVMPQDVPKAGASLLFAVKAILGNCSKPLFFSTDRSEINHAVIEMMQVAFAGDLKNQAFGISQLSPTSPLFWEETVIEALMDTVESHVPLAILPEPNAGVSAPYTLAGLLTVNNVECLSGIVMTQLLHPGAKVLYANSWTATDMRTGAALVGSTEMTICRIAGAQLGKFYRVPSHTTAPNSDNHAHDEQNAWEKCYSLFSSVAAGNDLIVNCGMFATGLTFSHEQLVMDEEMAAMSRRIVSGIEVNEETLAKDLIGTIGPAGEGYLTSDHTLHWLRSEEYYFPRLAVRGSRAQWEAAGSMDTYQLARAWVKQNSNLPGVPLEAKRAAEMDARMSRVL